MAPMALSMKGATHQKIADGTAMECRLSPRGVAAIITPFNFPLAIPIAQVVSALVTGNTVVWKPSHLTPETSHAMMKLLLTALKETGQRMHVRVPRGPPPVLGGLCPLADPGSCRYRPSPEPEPAATSPSSIRRRPWSLP